MSARLKLEGVFTALITPFSDDGSVDFGSFEKLVDAQIAAGVSGLVPIGTTGESPNLSAEEKEKIISICVKKAKASGKGVKVIAGTGSNSTATTVSSTQKAKSLGVDAVLVVNPYYNKPSQAGVIAHISEVNKVGVPIVLYNIPGRTSITLTAETITKIYNTCSNVVAVKESTGNLELALQIASLCDIQLMSGDDAITLPLLSLGATGCISVLSNFKPEVMKNIMSFNSENNKDKALKTAKQYYKLMSVMFCETNPVPVKFAMKLCGLIQSDKVRLPLVQMEETNKSKLIATLQEYKLL